MARQTRQQRRARRAQQQPALAGGTPPPAPPPVRPVDSGDSRPEPRKPDPKKEERHAPGSRFVRFVEEAWSELKKVEWPSQKGVVSGTVVVIVACIVVGTFLYVNDIVWKYVVQHVLLK